MRLLYKPKVTECFLSARTFYFFLIRIDRIDSLQDVVCERFFNVSGSGNMFESTKCNDTIGLKLERKKIPANYIMTLGVLSRVLDTLKISRGSHMENSAFFFLFCVFAFLFLNFLESKNEMLELSLIVS